MSLRIGGSVGCGMQAVGRIRQKSDPGTQVSGSGGQVGQAGQTVWRAYGWSDGAGKRVGHLGGRVGKLGRHTGRWVWRVRWAGRSAGSDGAIRYSLCHRSHN